MLFAWMALGSIAPPSTARFLPYSISSGRCSFKNGRSMTLLSFHGSFFRSRIHGTSRMAWLSAEVLWHSLSLTPNKLLVVEIFRNSQNTPFIHNVQSSCPYRNPQNKLISMATDHQGSACLETAQRVDDYFTANLMVCRKKSANQLDLCAIILSGPRGSAS